LDRIDDALVGEHLDRLELLADMHRHLSETVESVGRQIVEARARRPAARPPKGPRR
jgi:hypothetical protein